MAEDVQNLRIEILEESLKSLKRTTLDRKDYETILLKIEATAKATEALAKDVKDIKAEVKTFNDFISRWKGASLVIFTVGAIASFVVTQTVNVFKWVTGN